MFLDNNKLERQTMRLNFMVDANITLTIADKSKESQI